MAKRRGRTPEFEVTVTRKDRLQDEKIGELKLDDLEFKISPEAVTELNESIDNLHRNIQDENIRSVSAKKIKQVKREGQSITTDETKISHGLGSTPHRYFVTPKSNGVWWETRQQDANFIYLQASAAMTADIISEE